MTITAKFASTCPCCSNPIQPGQRVEWSKGEKAKHLSCAGVTESAPRADLTPGERILTATREGRRSYLRGDTLAVRGMLRSAGCHWDADVKAWWIGSHEAALELVAAAVSAPAEKAPPKRRANCVGCGCTLDRFQQQRGFAFCSRDCAIEKKHGSHFSGYVNGQWHQGSDD